jgi:hypothetical protein
VRAEHHIPCTVKAIMARKIFTNFTIMAEHEYIRLGSYIRKALYVVRDS